MSRLKKNIIAVCALMFVLPMALGGCTSSKHIVKKAQTPIEKECTSSCALMSKCSRISYSEHEKLVCIKQCSETNPILRAIVSECASKVFSESCNQQKMEACVSHKLHKLRTGR